MIMEMDNSFPIVLYETAIAWRNQLDKRLKPLGLSQAKWRTLVNVSLSKIPITQTELASRLGIEGATLAGLLDRLAKDGWIKRQDAVHDRRSKTVHLTPKSEKILTEISSIGTCLSNELLANISKSDLEHCILVMQKIKAQTEKLS